MKGAFDGMPRPRWYAAFLGRLRQKAMGMIPIVFGALILTLILSLVLYLAGPLLPEATQAFLEEVGSGNWEGSRERLVAVFDGYGSAKPLAFITVQVLQVLLAPIPGQFVGLLGGYLFGFWQGLGLTMLGLAIGSALAIGVGRMLGEAVVRRFIPSKALAKFDYLITDGGLWTFFMLFLLPALPDDAICFIAGLTRLRMWKLIAVCLLGRLPGMAVLLFVGASFGSGMAAANAALIIATVAAFFLWLYSEEAEQYFAGWIKRKTAPGRRGAK